MQISTEDLRYLQSTGHTAKEIGKLLNCSTSLVYKKLNVAGIPMRKKYARLTDEELDQKVTSLQEKFPNAGLRVRKRQTFQT